MKNAIALNFWKHLTDSQQNFLLVQMAKKKKKTYLKEISKFFKGVYLSNKNFL